MKRRAFLSGLGGTVATWPLVAGTMPALAQTPNRVYRLGHLANSPLSQAFDREITLPELAKLGFVEGRTLVFDGRIGGTEALPGLMRELLATRPDAVIAIGASFNARKGLKSTARRSSFNAATRGSS